MNDLLSTDGAIFSPCRKYRYVLCRVWDKTKPMAMFIGLNPSSTDELEDDNTIKRIKKIAQNLGYGGLYMTNLFSWVTKHPEELLKIIDPINLNDNYLVEYGKNVDKIIFPSQQGLS